MRWTDDDVRRVRELAEASASAGTIAAVFGVTRNMICGLCHRRGIALRNKPADGPRAQKGKPRASKPAGSAPTSKAQVVWTKPRARWSPPVAFRNPLPRPAPPAPVAPAVEPPPELAVPLHLTHNALIECRAPLWADGASPKTDDALVCGAPTLTGRAWCAFHTARFVQPSLKRSAA